MVGDLGELQYLFCKFLNLERPKVHHQHITELDMFAVMAYESIVGLSQYPCGSLVYVYLSSISECKPELTVFMHWYRKDSITDVYNSKEFSIWSQRI